MRPCSVVRAVGVLDGGAPLSWTCVAASCSNVVAGRDAQAPIRWLLAQPSAWREGIAWGTLDLSGAYRRSFDVALPHAGQVADPFHVIRLGNDTASTRRAAGSKTTHWGIAAANRTRSIGCGGCSFRLMNVSAKVPTPNSGVCSCTAGDPQGEVRLAWHAKETLRGLYDIDCPQLADAYLTHRHLTDTDCPPELSRLGRTLGRWHHQIINWHQSGHQRPYRSADNLIKRVKRTAFGFRRFSQLPDPGAALRRETQLGPAQHHHSPLISEESPKKPCAASMTLIAHDSPTPI